MKEKGMTPAKVLITGSGLYTPPNAIDNDALVASYKAAALDRFPALK